MRFIRGWFSARREATPDAEGLTTIAPGEEKKGKNRVGMRGLMVVVVAFAGIFWSVRTVREFIFPVKYWAWKLEKGEVDDRRQAAAELAKLLDVHIQVATSALVTGLHDEDAEVAAQAALSLQTGINAGIRLDDKPLIRRIVIALTAAMNDPRPRVRTAVVTALRPLFHAPNLIGPEGVSITKDAIDAALKDSSEEVRVSILGSQMELFRIQETHRKTPVAGGEEDGRTIGELPLETMLEILARDPSDRVRRMAAMILSEFHSGHDKIIIALLNALANGKSIETLQSYESALGHFQNLRGPEDESISPTIAPKLIEALGSPDSRIRFHAAAILGNIGPDAAPGITPLLKLLHEPVEPSLMSDPYHNAQIRDPGGQAALALGKIAPGSPRAGEVVEALIPIIRGPAIDWRRAAACIALARFEPKLIRPTVPILLAALEETVSKPRFPAPQICLALGKAGPGSPQAEKVLEALAGALNAKDSETYNTAATVLGDFGSRASFALPRLRELEKNSPFKYETEVFTKAILRITLPTDKETSK